MIFKKFTFLILLLVSNFSFSQCFQIESILVDACDSGGTSADEGFNEMFRIKIGATALNTSNLNVNWPSNTWQGLIQNTTTATKVAQLNADIIAAGGCGTVLEPTGGVLPANATVIIVSSQNFNITLNSFGALTANTYILFQDNTTVTTGHFGNYNATPGLRTLTVNFGTTCSDTVTYQRANLVNIFGISGGSTADNNGATVNFSPSGTPTYVNNGCTAPIPPFTVEAGTTPLSACPGDTINLTGTAQGQTSILWTAPSGSFSNPNNLITSYIVPTTAVSGSSITLTLTATNICGASISDNIVINISGSTLSLTSGSNNQTICSGDAITPIQYIFGGGATNVNITGLPSGVTSSIAGNVVTISGTPATNFSYSINTIGGCGTVTLNGTVAISSNATLSLTSGSNNQTICSGDAITPIQYTFGGGATNVNITGLPSGVTSSIAGNVVTISGTPATNFSYSINTIGGCGTVTLNGTVALSSNATLSLTSGSNNQTICSGDAITPIQYIFGGGATNVNITGLPSGVTSSIAGNVVTISGTPATNFSYSINTIGGCGTVTLNGTVAISSNATLSLTSGSNNQTICSGNAITPIQYIFGGGATNVNITGLPSGVTSSVAGNVVTISGTPTANFSYSINTIGGCGTVTLNGTVALSSNATLSLTSGSNNQTICSGDAITPIQYIFGGGATNVNITGLPSGVTSSIAGNVVTISGTPATNFSYSINTIGGCGTVTLNGTVAISSNATLSLTSGSNNQTICSGNAITPIQYIFGGGATNVNITGLPSGVTSSVAGNVVTISGTPTANFSYSINTIGGCGTVTLNGTVALSSNATLSLTSGSNNQTICSGDAITPIQYIFGGGATNVNITGLPSGVTSSIAGNVVTISGTPATNFSYSINTIGGCGTVTLNGTVAISSNATLSLTSGSNNQTICSGDAITPIQYIFGGGATNVNITGLPSGVTSSIAGNVVTISGTPTANFSYSINTIGGCGTVTLNGTVALSSNATLSLTSGSNNQTICSGDAITPIQYIFGGGATNVNITGLPSGVTSSIAGNVVTISGTPATNFSYSINTIGGCGTVTLNGTVAISSNATLSLTSGSNNQTICSGDAITPIQYIFGGGATNVNITGLPSGVTSSIAGNVVTISGTPATNFSYSINTIGGCGTVTLNGTVVISSNATLSLTSGSNNQTICSGDAITPIQYTFGGGATNVNITGLPSGVTSSVAGNVVTISGTPAANFSYLINTIGGCGTVTLNGTVASTSGITPLFTQITPVCQGTNINLPTTSTNGFTGVWQLISSSTTNVVYEFTPNAGQCASTTTMTIQIYPQPDVIISGNATYCDGDTTALTLTSTVPGTTFTWNVISSNLDGTHIVSGTGNTINQLLDLDNALNIGTATYYITPYANGCAGPAQQIEITVNPIPDVVAVATSTEICSGDTAHVDMTSAISGVTYTWTVVSTGVNGASNGTGSSIDQVLTTSNPSVGGNVVYTITPSLNGCTGASVTVQIDVKPRPEFFGTISPITICSGETTNINLSASIPGTDFEWIVVATNVSGASDGTGSNIGQTLTSVLGGTVVYSVVPVLNGCSGSPIQVTVIVNPLPQPVLEDGTLCIVQATGEVYQTYTLDTGLSAIGYSFDWYLDGVLIPAANGPTHIADEVGVYSVIVTNTTTTCVSAEEFATVDFVYPETSFTATVTNAFTDNATITITVAGDGTGTLLYQLDEGALQSSNVFTGVSAGTHTVTVVDTEGCTFITQTVLVIDYPKYFTPNGDGENDTWNIIGMDQADAKLYIFDRYGKLIKQLSATAGSEGWDGTFNNQQLPSTDYWFTIDYTENGAAKQFKAHFSLKR